MIGLIGIDCATDPPAARGHLWRSTAGRRTTGRFYVNGTLNYTDEAYWTDVLDSRFWGTTDSFTLVNLGFGVRFNNEKVTFAVIGTNIFDEDFQAHIFGDIIPRKITGELRFKF